MLSSLSFLPLLPLSPLCILRRRLFHLIEPHRTYFTPGRPLPTYSTLSRAPSCRLPRSLLGAPARHGVRKGGIDGSPPSRFRFLMLYNLTAQCSSLDRCLGERLPLGRTSGVEGMHFRHGLGCLPSFICLGGEADG